MHSAEFPKSERGSTFAYHQPCGCVVRQSFIKTEGEWDDPSVEWCPLHAAAPRLYEALEKLLVPSHTPETWDAALAEARAALAAARGEEE